MGKAYLETSFINLIADSSINGKELSLCLNSQGLAPVIGMHTIYELARTYLDRNGRNRGMRVFSIIRDLEPSFMPMTGNLLQQEVERLRHGSVVLPYYSQNNHVAVKMEVCRLAEGEFSDEAKEFISKRESLIISRLPGLYGSKLNGSTKKQAGVFEDYVVRVSCHVPNIISRIINGHASISIEESRELALRLDSFPTVRSAVRANLYLNYICERHGTPPGKDKHDDYRHIMDASYCDVLITHDKQMQRTAGFINPDIESRSFDT